MFIFEVDVLACEISREKPKNPIDRVIDCAYEAAVTDSLNFTNNKLNQGKQKVCSSLNNYYGTMHFMSKQVSLSKISSILKKMKIGQKTDIPPLLHEGLCAWCNNSLHLFW